MNNIVYIYQYLSALSSRLRLIEIDLVHDDDYFYLLKVVVLATLEAATARFPPGALLIQRLLAPTARRHAKYASSAVPRPRLACTNAEVRGAESASLSE